MLSRRKWWQYGWRDGSMKTLVGSPTFFILYSFEEVGLDNEEKVREVGKRFRDTVLSLGGGEDPMTVFKQFRGREPSPDALLRHSGLA